MKNNIQKLYLANFFTGVVFWYGIEKLFMTDIGISAFGVGLNATLFILIVVLFDIPSGVLADKWKRRNTLMLAVASLAASSLILGLSNNLATYLIGTILYAGYIVLSSGTYQAITYDSLYEIGLHKKYDKYQGRSYALFLAGIAISSLAGGYISEAFGFRWAYYLTILFSFFAFLSIWSMTEPKFHKLETDSKLAAHIKLSIKSVISSKLLFQLALFSIVAGMLRHTLNEYAGLYYIALGLTAIPTGYANAAKWLSGVFGQLVSEKIGRVALKFIPLFYLSFLLFSVHDSLWGLVFFYVAVFLHAILTNQAEAEIQENTPSEVRATTLSVLGFVTNIILIPLGLLFGWIAQEYDVYAAYQLFAAIGVLYLFMWLFKGRVVIKKRVLGN